MFSPYFLKIFLLSCIRMRHVKRSLIVIEQHLLVKAFEHACELNFHATLLVSHCQIDRHKITSALEYSSLSVLLVQVPKKQQKHTIFLSTFFIIRLMVGELHSTPKTKNSIESNKMFCIQKLSGDLSEFGFFFYSLQPMVMMISMEATSFAFNI